MNNKFRSIIIDQLNNLTSLFFFYSIFTISFPSNLLLKKQIILTDKSTFNDSLVKTSRVIETNYQKRLAEKIYFDLNYREILRSSENDFVTQISIDKEGKITGYKPSKLRVISYSLEKQIISLLKKNILITKINKSIYWLHVTNKY